MPADDDPAATATGTGTDGSGRPVHETSARVPPHPAGNASEQPTESSVESKLVQRSCNELYAEFYEKYEAAQSKVLLTDRKPTDPTPAALQELGQSVFDRARHVAFLQIPGDMHKCRRSLPKPFVALENSQPWILFWTLQALDVLGAADAYIAEHRTSMVSFLLLCQSPTLGGFGGGPGQLPHLATTYAAVSTLAILGSLDSIDRPALKKFLITCRQPGAGFTMQNDGEVDIRGAYCAIASASLAEVLCEELTAGLGEYIGSCQRPDGGIAGDIDGEGHAGYSYCGVATLCILNQAHIHLHLPRLVNWLVHRQLKIEGGFNGRPQKLVDACYSFWVAGSLALARFAMYQDSKLRLTLTPGECWISPTALKAYLILCCQPCITQAQQAAAQIPEHFAQTGGLCDKPGKKPDFYHTCYALSGMALVQQWLDPDEVARSSEATRWFETTGMPRLAPLNAMFNLTVPRLAAAMTWNHTPKGPGVCPFIDFCNWDVPPAPTVEATSEVPSEMGGRP